MAKSNFDKAEFTRKLELAVKEKADLSKLSASSLKQIADVLLTEIKTRIASGISPIYGKRFPAYKNPKKYPAKKKPTRPVNLYLSGDFLAALTVRVKTGKIPSLTIFFKNKSEELKEEGHRDGANGQLKRPIIPQAGEGFTDGILVAVRQVFRRVIDKDLK